MKIRKLKDNRVEFSLDGMKHIRTVNPVLDDTGKIDKKATSTRIDEVAAGVKVKMELGIIGT